MRGTVLNYDARSGSGLISADDGTRYTFNGTDVSADFERIAPGVTVDFQIQGTTAAAIYPIGPAQRATGEKSKIAAGLLAIFLGGLGIHKFYMGQNKAGVIMLLCSLVGVFLILPAVIVWIIALIEGIIYLTKSDADFHQTYEIDGKAWL